MISPIVDSLETSKFTCEFITPHSTFDTKVNLEFEGDGRLHGKAAKLKLEVDELKFQPKPKIIKLELELDHEKECSSFELILNVQKLLEHLAETW